MHSAPALACKSLAGWAALEESKEEHLVGPTLAGVSPPLRGPQPGAHYLTGGRGGTKGREASQLLGRRQGWGHGGTGKNKARQSGALLALARSLAQKGAERVLSLLEASSAPINAASKS